MNYDVQLPLWIVTGALTIIVFFLRQYISELKEVRKSLTELVRNEAAKNASCTEKHISINARLRKHDEQMEDIKEDIVEHAKQIAHIQTKIKI